ncbi:unnamed protein product, partial [Notodromas monacha]
MATHRPVFGYWRLRGLGQSIKLLLAHAGVDYQLKEYPLDWEEWSADKYGLKLDFPNLPFYIDDQEGVRLTQSLTILRFLGRKHGLMPKIEKEIQRAELCEQQMEDLRKAIVELVYKDWV